MSPQTAVYNPPEIQQGVAYGWDTQVTGYDLTGATVQCQLRRATGSADVVLDWSTVTTPVAVDAVGDPQRIMWRLTDDEAAAIPAGTYVYDVEIHRSGVCEKRLMAGRWTVSAEVTRG